MISLIKDSFFLFFWHSFWLSCVFVMKKKKQLNTTKKKNHQLNINSGHWGQLLSVTLFHASTLSSGQWIAWRWHSGMKLSLLEVYFGVPISLPPCQNPFLALLSVAFFVSSLISSTVWNIPFNYFLMSADYIMCFAFIWPLVTLICPILSTHLKDHLYLQIEVHHQYFWQFMVLAPLLIWTSKHLNFTQLPD